MSDGVLENRIGRVLAALAKTGGSLGLAESCTGGLLGHLITETPGASAVFKGGVVAYGNDVKERVLGVSAQTLAEEGAVSEATAREMALGAAQLLGATHAMAVTGIAGPGGGSPEKPVGLVYIAVGDLSRLTVRRCLFDGDRSAVKRQTAEVAFAMIEEFIGS